MDIKNFFKDNRLCIICAVIGFGVGFLVGAALAPHHNRLELHLFSGNGCGNRDNSANCGSGGVAKKKKDR